MRLALVLCVLASPIYAQSLFSVGPVPMTVSPDGTNAIGGVTTATSAVAGGTGFVLVLDGSGRVSSVGGNEDGELGVGAIAGRSTASQIDALSQVVSIAAGFSHAMAIDQASRVWTWGSNVRGQLGRTTVGTSAFSPATIATSEVIRNIAAGGQHSIIIGSGTLYSFGAGSSGQLGLGDTVDRQTPTLVSLPTTTLVISEVSCGEGHTLVLAGSGTVYAWGSNMQGQLGVSGVTGQSNTPQVLTLDGASVSSVHGGGNSSVIISAAGAAYVFGENSQGQLGLGDSILRFTPTLLRSSTGLFTLQSMAIARYFSLLCLSDGSVYTSGQISSSPVSSSTVPIALPNAPTNVIALDDADSFAIILTKPTPYLSQSSSVPWLIIGIFIAIGVLIIIIFIILVIVWKRRTKSAEEGYALKSQEEARLRLGMAQGDTLALEEHTHRTWSVGSGNPVTGEPFEVLVIPDKKNWDAYGSDGDATEAGELRELDKLEPWRPEEDDEPIMAFRIITNRARIKAARLVAAAVFFGTPEYEHDDKALAIAQALRDRYSCESCGQSTIDDANDVDASDSDFSDESPQLEASVVPGPVRGWVRENQEVQQQSQMSEAMKMISMMVQMPTKKEVGPTSSSSAAGGPPTQFGMG